MVLTLNPVKYGQLLSQTMPKRIETDEELDHFAAVMEELSRAIAHGAASPEETALHSLLATLVKEYDDRAHPLPPGDPVRLLQFLMDQRGLRAAGNQFIQGGVVKNTIGGDAGFVGDFQTPALQGG